jgi:glycosyltransferase 2 family protein
VPGRHVGLPLNRRLLQTGILVVGLGGLAVAVARTVDDARDQVLPSAGALAVAGGLALVSILASGRAWVTLFHEVLDSGKARLRFEAGYYLSQLTKYLPAGGVVQAASQFSLAAACGVPLGRVALAFPVSVVGTVAAGLTLGAGIALAGELPTWARALALVGLAAPALLHRRFMVALLGLARRYVRRIPAPDRLPSQRSILAYYVWALGGIAATAAAYAVLLRSLTDEASPTIVFFAFALSWTLGFLVVPLPAGIGIRELILIAAIPEVGAGPVLAASLAHRLLGIGAELVAALGSNLAARRKALPQPPAPERLPQGPVGRP